MMLKRKRKEDDDDDYAGDNAVVDDDDDDDDEEEEEEEEELEEGIASVFNSTLHMTFCTHLINVILFYGVVEDGVQVVKEVDDLDRTANWRQRRESHNVREIDRHLLKHFRFHSLPFLQLLGYSPNTNISIVVVSG